MRTADTGHTDPVLSVAWNHDGTRLATASDDGTARIWDPTTGRAEAVLVGHPEGFISQFGGALVGTARALDAVAVRDDTGRRWVASHVLCTIVDWETAVAY